MNDHEIATFKELILQAIQAGKRETSGIVDDLRKHYTELDKKFEIHNHEHARTNDHLSRIDSHLGILNGKVAANSLHISELNTYNTVNKDHIDILMKDLSLREIELKSSTRKWKERALWIAVMIALFLLTQVGAVSQEFAGVLTK